MPRRPAVGGWRRFVAGSLFHGPEPLPARDVAGFSGPVMRPCSLPGKLFWLGARDRVPVQPEARDPTSGNVRCLRRPRRQRSVRRRGGTGGEDSRGRPVSPPRSPPRDRIAARPPRRRGGSGNCGSPSMGPYSSGAGGKRRSGPPSISDCSRSSSSKPGIGRDEGGGGGEGTAGRARAPDVVPAQRRGRLRVLPRRSPRALPPAREPRARPARGDDGLALQARSRGRRAAGETLFAGCGWEGGRDQMVPPVLLVSSVVLRARPGGIRARGGVPGRDPALVPAPVLDQDPSPARLSRPRGTTQLQAGLCEGSSRRGAGGFNAVGSGRGVRRLGCGVLLIPQSLPEAAGHFGAIAAPTNGPVRALH